MDIIISKIETNITNDNGAFVTETVFCTLLTVYISLLVSGVIIDCRGTKLRWNGFEFCTQIGLEVQQPWSMAILCGKKSIETRSYNLPSSLLNPS